MPLAAVAGIGAIGSIAGGLIGSSAAKNAANTQAAAANHAADLERQSATDALNFNKQQYGNSLNLLSPFYNTGVSANSRLASLMGLRPASGLPAGVINPNAPPQAQNPGAGGFSPGGAFDNNSVFNRLRGGGGTGGNVPIPMQAQSAMMQPGGIHTPGAPAPGGTAPQGQPGSVLNGLLPGEGGHPGGAMGMLQLGPDGKPVGVTPDVHPDPGGTLNLNPSPNGPTPTPADGSPGTVPRTDGSGTIPTDGSAPDPSQGMNFGGSPNSGGFGSLATGWNQTFKSPDAVTEQNDPGYQFRLQQGQQALQNSAAARGGLLSGGTAKALTDYNQNAASGEYGNVYNRALQNYNTNYNTFTNDQTNTFNRLQALSGGGQTAANNLSASGITAAGNAANIGLTSAGQIGQQYNNAGAANASGYINSANAINGAIGGASNSLSTLAMLRMLQSGGGTGGSTSGGWGAY